MKTLIVVAHPNIGASVVNSAWIKGFANSPVEVTVRDIYKIHPDGKIDVEAE